MKKILFNILLIIVLIFSLSACSENKEEKIPTINDYPSDRIKQTVGVVMDFERLPKEHEYKYKYTIDSILSPNKFTAIAYDNYYFENEQNVIVLYAEEKNEKIILELKPYEEPEKKTTLTEIYGEITVRDAQTGEIVSGEERHKKLEQIRKQQEKEQLENNEE